MDAKAKLEQLELLSTIDSILAALERQKTLDLDLKLNVNVSSNAFAFLLDIIKRFTTDTKIINWLVDILTVSLPGIELAVKGALLSHLSKMVSCNTDSKIPYYLRHLPGGKDFSTERGFVFHPKNIDYNNIFAYSPLSEQGGTMYLGTLKYYTIPNDDTKYYSYLQAVKAIQKQYKNTDEIPYDLSSKIVKHGNVKNFYELSRADDFNAFLWFVGNKCRFLGHKECVSEEGLLESFNGVKQNDDKTNIYSTGDLIKGNNNLYALCWHGFEKNKSNESFQLQVLPCSYQENGANWYVNRGSYFNFLKAEKDRKPRNYDEEFAICNVSYAHNYSTDTNVYPSGTMRFTILPSPTVYKAQGLDSPILPRRILFNKNGEATSKGKYSVMCDWTKYEEADDYNDYYITESNWKLRIYKTSLDYELVKDNDDTILSDVLFECYPGHTIYEFNYDYLMGMQLFDPKVLTCTLMNMAFNTLKGIDDRGGISASVRVDKSESAYQKRICEIVKNIVESETSTVSDCFFTFSNEKYDELLNQAELKRSHNYQFSDENNHIANVNMSDVFNILQEFNDNGTLQENQDILTRAITQATANITKEVLPSDQYSVKLNLLTNLVNALTMSIVETILSPKIILLFELNRMQTSDVKDIFEYDEEYFEALLKSMMNLIVGIVKEIRDYILGLMLEWVVSIVQELAEKLAVLIVKEKLEVYTTLLKKLIDACKFSFPLFGRRQLLDSELDMVNYAEIDEIEKPNENNC